jgi:hypothetical protein
MTKDLALKLAIEYIENSGGWGNTSKVVIQACKDALEQPTGQPTRLEVIDADGRTYTNWKVKDMQFSYQDDGRTLKIFIKESE